MTTIYRKHTDNDNQSRRNKMKLTCIGTGSSGNTYLIDDGQEVLVLDAGCSFRDVKIALGFQISRIRGVLITHCHGDHHKYAHEYEAAGIPVWRPYEDEKSRQSAHFGNFYVQSVPMVHNVPCVGYLIAHREMGRMLYATDTEYIRYRFRDLNVILVEANYADEYVNRDEAKYFHVLTGHMNITTTVDFIKNNSGPALHHVILCHLSQQAADPDEFRKAIEAIAPDGCCVDVAVPRLTVDLGDVPF